MYFIDCLNNNLMSESDVVNIIIMCKDYLKESYDTIDMNLLKN